VHLFPLGAGHRFHGEPVPPAVGTVMEPLGGGYARSNTWATETHQN
jgi:hypothetical protein